VAWTTISWCLPNTSPNCNCLRQLTLSNPCPVTDDSHEFIQANVGIAGPTDNRTTLIDFNILNLRQGQDLSLLHKDQTGSRAHPREAISPGGEETGCEADYSPPCSAKVKNGGAIPLLSHMSSWHCASLIKHRDKFTFTSSSFHRL
jgi:hypothetical protein